MSADSRIWTKAQWDRYHLKQYNLISGLYLSGQMTTTGMFEEKDRVYQEFSVYVRARMQLWKRGYLKELEF